MRWDSYFLSLAEHISKQSKCLSRQVGAVIVRDEKYPISMGYNGPPTGYPHCKAKDLSGNLVCPRRALGFKSGQGLHLCPSSHAERNAIYLAARNGISVKGSTIYCHCNIPCIECTKAIIQSGISEVVCLSFVEYQDNVSSEDMMRRCGIKLRMSMV